MNEFNEVIENVTEGLDSNAIGVALDVKPKTSNGRKTLIGTVIAAVAVVIAFIAGNATGKKKANNDKTEKPKKRQARHNKKTKKQVEADEDYDYDCDNDEVVENDDEEKK